MSAAGSVHGSCIDRRLRRGRGGGESRLVNVTDFKVDPRNVAPLVNKNLDINLHVDFPYHVTFPNPTSDTESGEDGEEDDDKEKGGASHSKTEKVGKVGDK